MTNEQIKRTKEALYETQTKLFKEMNYMPHNRNQGMIEFYVSHIAKLQAMLGA